MKTLVLGIGGGGDSVSALVAYSYRKKLGEEVHLGSVVWERYVIDPIPGPICHEDFRNAKKYNEAISIVDKNSYAIRGGLEIKPQLVNVLSVINEEGYAICIKKGVSNVISSLKELIENEGFDLVIGVDAGGDVLAKGNEKELLSPLIDNIMLASLAGLEMKGFNCQVATIGLGCDGELKSDYALQRISEVAKLGGLIDIKGIDKEAAILLEKALLISGTEASRIPYEAFKGAFGRMKIRKGLLEVDVSPLSAVMFFLDPLKLSELNLVFKKMLNSKSLEEANQIFHEIGILTEYDVEEELFRRYGINARFVDPIIVKEIRSKGLLNRD